MSLQNNPLVAGSSLPQFDKILPVHVVPAVRRALKVAEEEFSRIERDANPSWEGIMTPLAEIDLKLSEVISPVIHLNGVRNSDELRKAYEEIQGEIVSFGLRASQSEPVYQKVKSIYESQDFKNWDSPKRRVIEKYIQNAEISGIGLQGEEREEFNRLSKELTQLSTNFSNHLLDANKEFSMVLEKAADTKGLPASFLSMAAQSYNQKFPDCEKKASPEKGPWLVTLDFPSFGPFMENSECRPLREKLYRSFICRASEEPFDNKPLITKILKLRRKMAKLLGFKTYAALSIGRKMAGNVETVYELLDSLRQASWDTAQSELKELENLARSKNAEMPLMNWDVAYWAKRLQEEKFDYSDEDLRPYFALPNVLKGLFELVQRLFGIRVEEAPDETSVWHKDVRFFHIYDENDQQIASFYLDPYSRPENKRGGAWMDECKTRYRKSDQKIQKPVAYLVCNSTPPVDDAPSLLTFREVETLFHEFGHGLQHMLTNVELSDVSGINGIEWDAVELASQFMENWCYHRKTLMSMAVHYESGEQMPESLFQKLLASKTFRAGGLMLRQIQVGLVDLELHEKWDPESGDITPFDIQAEVAEKTSVMKPLKEDQFLCSFSHIFAGGYAAGYYSYKWAEVLSADAFSAFEEVGLDQEEKVAEVGKRYRDTILSSGGSEHPMEVFKKFRGREPDTTALLRHSGLSESRSSSARDTRP